MSKTLARRTAVFGWIVLVIGHEGLKFHDGEPVLSKDVVASINRWAARDSMGQMIKTTENELVATDDRTFRWSLKKPYPKILLALGKIGTPCCFVMPARIAATDPYKQINEYVGSGPMRFVKEEWTPGAKAVFEKVADYRPRAEPASWQAGGKRIASDRIEWIIIADQATAAAALQNGEVDWLELPLPDIVPVLRRNRNITIDVADPMGYIGTLFFNHLYPPFNDVRARRAVLMALNQEDYMRAYVGSDDAMWKPLPSYFTPGSALYNEEGGDVLKGRRNLDVAKRLLAESGYRDEPVTSMAAQDIGAHKAWGASRRTCSRASALRSITPPWIGAPWLRAGPRNRRLAKVAGKFSTPTGTGSTASTRPAGSFARTATRHFSGGRTTRKSKPRSPPGTKPIHSMKKERLRAG